jgi:hypothetical protein
MDMNGASILLNLDALLKPSAAIEKTVNDIQDMLDICLSGAGNGAICPRLIYPKTSSRRVNK